MISCVQGDSGVDLQNPNSTILVTMAVMGNTSRGKYIFLIKDALEVTLLTPSEADS